MALPDDIVLQEQYDDLVRIIDELLPRLVDEELDNSHPLGRLKGELLWLRQEAIAQNIPMPGRSSMASTSAYLAGNPMFPDEDEFIVRRLYNIISVIECNGLVKPRHHKRLIELIEGLVNEISEVLSVPNTLKNEEKENLEHLMYEMKHVAKLAYEGALHKLLPLSRREFPFFWNPKPRSNVKKKNRQLYDAEDKIRGPLDSNWRPRQSQPTLGWEIPAWVKES